MIGNATIILIDTAYQGDLKKELRDQGHYLTGALERSIHSRQSTSGGTVVSEIEALDYAEDLFEGVRPEHIDPYDPTYLKGLTEYAKKRFPGQPAFKIAVSISLKHSKEGNPTQASYEFSSTGERLFANIEAYNKNESEYAQFLEDGVSREIDQFIDKTFEQTFF